MYYNDFIGMIEGVEKLIAIENEQGLDVFKESVSLASLTQKYLQRNRSDNDYFSGISERHKHIHKDLKTLGIVGGPSIIFHRIHEANVTMIKGKHLQRAPRLFWTQEYMRINVNRLLLSS